MKMRGTKERRRDRYEFIYKYRDEMAKLVDRRNSDEEVRKFVEEKCRPELNYSVRTNIVDIFCTMRRDYAKIFIHQ